MKYTFLRCIFIFSILFKIIYSKRPIFGIYSIPEPISDNETFNNESIDANYIYWLESAGADVIPIHVWYSQEQLYEILSRINGVLWQGSFRLLNFSSSWEKNAKYIFNYSVENHLPIFGICFGFRLLNVIMSKNDSLIHKTRNHGNHNIYFNENTKNSTLFSLFKEKDFESFKTENTTAFIHRFGITTEMFHNEKNLINNYTLTSIGYDLDGLEFIDSIENNKYNIYGTQFHPEKTPFLKTKKYKREHSNDSIRRSQLLAMKVVDIGRNYIPKNKIEDLEIFKKKYDLIYTFQKNKFKYKFDKEINFYYFEKD